MAIASMRLQRILDRKTEGERGRKGAEIDTLHSTLQRSLIRDSLQIFRQGVIKGAESNELRDKIARSIVFIQ